MARDSITLKDSQTNSFTMLSDLFIDRHMPSANGEFVKVYIYLLRLMQKNQQGFSLASAADVFACTEKDILRALLFWEKSGLLALDRSEDEIAGIRFVRPEDAGGLLRPEDTGGLLRPEESEVPDAGWQRAVSSALGASDVSGAGRQRADSSAQGASEVPDAGRQRADSSAPEASVVPDTGRQGADSSAPGRHVSFSSGQGSDQAQLPVTFPGSLSLSNSRTQQLKEQDEVRQIIMVAEEYLGRTLSTTDLNRLLYLYDELHFSADLIDYLIEYCVLKEKRSMHYIEKVGLEWYNDGVKTVPEAKERAKMWSRDYYTILRSFGITGRNPVSKEIQFMKRWRTTFGFSMDIIREACERTVTQTGRASFDYADKILSAWHEAGVHETADIAVLDRRHSTSAAKGGGTRAASDASGRRAERTARHPNQFNNFSQRSYDFDALERAILDQQNKGT